MKELKIKEIFETPRGKLFIIDPDENNISRKRDENLLNTEVLYKNNLYKIIGIESHASAGDYIGNIGILTQFIN